MSGLPEHDADTHGYNAAGAEHELLRGLPPERALRWAAKSIGDRARCGQVRALEGGTSSAVHAIDIDDADGQTHRLVLRRFVRADWLREEPDLARREAAALRAVRACSLATPVLVAVDPDGRDAGAPAILMTRLSGAPDWDPPDLEAYLHALVVVLPAIHATLIPASLSIRPYQAYEPHPRHPPSWTGEPGLWHRAISLFEGPPPPHGPCLIHRDYHPGNVLWTGGTVTGVVDWVNASIGSADADVGHCRWQLAGRFGLPAADRFRELYAGAAGRHEEQHPYWDIVAALGGRAERDLDRADERFLAHVLGQR